MQILNWSSEFGDKLEVAKMLENDERKEIKITMPSGTFMKEHKAPGAISVQVLSGEIDFSVGDTTHNLKALDMISLEAEVVHALVAKTNSIIRLTLSKIDSEKRVFKLAQ